MTSDVRTTIETKISAPEGLPYIDMERAFRAPRELVFRAFIEPDLLSQWIGPRRMSTRVEAWDVRDGGRWRYVQTDTDGGEYAFHGVFHGTMTPDRMVQTFEFEGYPGHVSLETMRLETRDGMTVLHGRSVYERVADRDAMVASGMETGVNEGYERLDELLRHLSDG